METGSLRLFEYKFPVSLHGAAEYCFVMSQVADYYLGDSEE
jgi:hypothetical protein